ncbi:hypothetical protein A1Q2_05231 [Trichosporon asahii var. asahii CBS 8904]|uniref:Uncharacterized protein n=1 Tax=Trichosporon asahii var. asahii (strain CBS 8904) TaxID=1220162 RepID=K1VIH4_TRIAC|nr:hypothetical protein A1Q2_05231 [Trichosporon asahii var. asahii CBS 8904]
MLTQSLTDHRVPLWPPPGRPTSQPRPPTAHDPELEREAKRDLERRSRDRELETLPYPANKEPRLSPARSMVAHPSAYTDLSTSPIALTSSSLSAARRYRTFSSARSTVSSSISGISGRDIRTPSRPRASLPLFSSELGLGAPSPETPRRVSAPLSHTTPESLGAGLPGGPGSPLVPIQFIRKASESPSVRNKEREQLSNLPGLGA